jgi:hypothetical protein
LIGEELPHPTILTVDEQKLFAALFAMVAVISVALKWELQGRILTIVDYLFFAFVKKK